MPVTSAITRRFPGRIRDTIYSDVSFRTVFGVNGQGVGGSFVLSSSLCFHAVKVRIVDNGPGSLAGPSILFLSRSITQRTFNRRGPVKGALRVVI